ncbi:MAG: VWA domain-containing protein [Anaerolineae bacterium]|nr:VWA domain-containing protein [Anaerolineae bacterium]
MSADEESPFQGVPLRGHHADVQPLNYLRQPSKAVRIGKAFKPRSLQTPFSDRLSRKIAGKRSYTITSRKRGRYTFARPAQGWADDIALDATLRQAAIYQRRRQPAPTAVVILKSDLQRKVRVRKAANLILFVVDASWSMAASERMEATKGAIMSLLVDAYQKRDRVAMITFQKDRARLVLPPTSSVEMAKRVLGEIPVGGKTPLSAGLMLAYELIEREKQRNAEIIPLMILLTDGAGNVSMMGLPPQEEALFVAGMFAERKIHSVVVNTEHPALDRGLAEELAEKLGARYYTLTDLRAESLYQTVRTELERR